MRDDIDKTSEEDAVGLILRQWAVERPDLDVSAMGILGRLSRIAKLLDKSLAETFGRYGLNGGEFDVLATLRRSGEPYSLTPTELYRSMMLSSAAMTNRIDRLEVRKLVVREPDPEDRRGVRVRLTAEGFRLIEDAVAAHVEGQQHLISDLNLKQREHLAGLLASLMISMETPQHTEEGPADIH